MRLATLTTWALFLQLLSPQVFGGQAPFRYRTYVTESGAVVTPDFYLENEEEVIEKTGGISEIILEFWDGSIERETLSNSIPLDAHAILKAVEQSPNSLEPIEELVRTGKIFIAPGISITQEAIDEYLLDRNKPLENKLRIQYDMSDLIANLCAYEEALLLLEKERFFVKAYQGTSDPLNSGDGINLIGRFATGLQSAYSGYYKHRYVNSLAKRAAQRLEWIERIESEILKELESN